MSGQVNAVDTVEVYWRPGCPACRTLLGPLRRSGLPLREVNIHADPVAAARVRAATGGDETVPTVFLGERTLIAPTPDRAFAAVREYAPVLAARLRPVRPDRLALLAPLVVLAGWVVLTARHPDVTYHVAPLFAAAVAAVATRRRAGRIVPRATANRLGAAGAAVTGLTTVILSTAHRLSGPDLFHGGHSTSEALVLGVLGGVLGAGYACNWWRR